MESWSFIGNCRSNSRSRFNLLLLEHGEYFFKDHQVHYLPQRENKGSGLGSTSTFLQVSRHKIQGRLKICSRSIVFEPDDVSIPIVKFPFRHMPKPPVPIQPSPQETQFIDFDTENILEFYSLVTTEMKANNVIAPYVMRKFEDIDNNDNIDNDNREGGNTTPPATGGTNPPLTGPQFTFALLHSSKNDFLSLAERLRRISMQVASSKAVAEEELLEPVLAAFNASIRHDYDAELPSNRAGYNRRGSLSKGVRMYQPDMGGLGGSGGVGAGGGPPLPGSSGLLAATPFDILHLVDYKEELLLSRYVPCDRILPLIRSPGTMMVTTTRVYFQPTALNNIGESILSHPLEAVTKVYRRIRMLRDTSMEIFFRRGRSGPGLGLGKGSLLGSGSGSGSGFDSLYLTFPTRRQREIVFGVLSDAINNLPLSRNRGIASTNPYSQNQNHGQSRSQSQSHFNHPAVQVPLPEMTRRWQQRRISNLEYLIYLNSVADRSVNDLTQYPVLPWVVHDYASPKLRLQDPAVYRDLRKPIGALDGARLEHYRARYQSMVPRGGGGSSSGTSSSMGVSGGAGQVAGPHPPPPPSSVSGFADPAQSPGGGLPLSLPPQPQPQPGEDANAHALELITNPPPFLYGTHYSTPGYVLHYLVRAGPEYMLCLQNGRFDAPDRLFDSIALSYQSCLQNMADVKELVPEFYTGNGGFLMNARGLPLGRKQSGAVVGDVVLPPWAWDGVEIDPTGVVLGGSGSSGGSDLKTPYAAAAANFIAQMRAALESDVVSQQLHHWVDLVFGYKQRGGEALRADNLFYTLTYQDSIDLERVTDVRLRASLEAQIEEFGQCPRQLFLAPHPSRDEED